MEKIYLAAKYIRTSCPDNESECGDSISNQRRLIDAFVRAQPNITAISEQIDEGYSGLFTDRPAFKDLLREIETGAINCVIVRDLSRLSRDYIETGRYLRDYFPAHGVRFISIDDNIDSVSLDGFDKMITLLKSIFSEQYVCDVSVKTRSAMDAKRKQGQYVGAIPIYGYLKSTDNKNRLIPNPDTYNVVRSIFQMKLQGMSSAKITAVLNGSCIPSPLAYKRKLGIAHPTGGFADRQNARWSTTTILRILQDETYTGTLVQGRQRSLSYKTKIMKKLDEAEWIKTKNAHPAIIPRSDYEAVQRVLSTDTRTSPGRGSVGVFSGILICGCCGVNMTRKTVPYKTKHYINYYCSTGKRNGCASPAIIGEKDLMQIITTKIKERIADVENLSLSSFTELSEKSMRDDLMRQINYCTEKIHTLENFKIHLHDSKAGGFINDVELQTLYDFYNMEIALSNVEIHDGWDKLQKIGSLCVDHIEWMQNFLQFTGMIELCRYAVVKMIHSIRITAQKELIVDFVYQSEYEQLVRCIVLGGDIDGKKKPQTE